MLLCHYLVCPFPKGYPVGLVLPFLFRKAPRGELVHAVGGHTTLLLAVIVSEPSSGFHRMGNRDIRDSRDGRMILEEPVSRGKY